MPGVNMVTVSENANKC